MKIIRGSKDRPRLSVFRSNKAIYAQIIDDQERKTLAAAMSKKGKGTKKSNKVEEASLVGEELAAKAKKAGVKKVVFDRSTYKYHGRVKALAEAARKGGLDF